MTSNDHKSLKSPVLTIAVSSRALFNFEKEHQLFADKGEDSYMKLQKQLLKKEAMTGVAFPLVQKLLTMNDGASQPLVEIVVLSRNDSITGLRVFRSIAHYELGIRRGCFTRGMAVYPYLQSFGAHLFISAAADDVRHALENGVPAAHVRPQNKLFENDDTLRIAFDGDSVLFSDESERVFQSKGLQAFEEMEVLLSEKPMSPGPLKPFLDALHQLRQCVSVDKIRTALITSRGAPTHERVINTLQDWKVDVDETFFLGGMEKQSIISSFNPDFYFDDQPIHLKGVDMGGHVDSGVTNE